MNNAENTVNEIVAKCACLSAVQVCEASGLDLYGLPKQVEELAHAKDWHAAWTPLWHLFYACGVLRSNGTKGKARTAEKCSTAVAEAIDKIRAVWVADHGTETSEPEAEATAAE